MPKTCPSVILRAYSHGKHEIMFGMFIQDHIRHESHGSDPRIDYHVPDKMRSFVEVHGVKEATRLEEHLRANLRDVVLYKRSDAADVLDVMSSSVSPPKLAQYVIDFLGSDQVVGGDENAYQQIARNLMRDRRSKAATALSVFTAVRSFGGRDLLQYPIQNDKTHLSDVWRGRVDAAYMMSIMHLDLSRAISVLTKVVHDEPDQNSWWLRA
jgi:hypothetical protein